MDKIVLEPSVSYLSVYVNYLSCLAPLVGYVYSLCLYGSLEVVLLNYSYLYKRVCYS